MADTLDTTLRFLGDPGGAQNAINSLIASLQKAAQQTASLFSGTTATANQSTAALNQTTAATNAVSAATSKLAAEAAKAEAAMFRQAQIQARIQQISGDSAGAIKTLGEALSKATDPKSLPALRAELQKTYLDTNYANSPLIGAIRQISQSFSFLRPVLGQTAGSLQQITGVAGGAAEGLGGTASATAGLSVALGAVALAIGAVVVGIGAIVTVSQAAASALLSIGEAGVDTNAKLESLKLGITTVIASVAEIRNSEGIKLTGIDALNAALPIAADQVRKLRIDALATSATIADIGPAFQAAIGPGLVAGLTIDQIRENTIKLTQAVTALGLPMDQIKQETRAILSGDINRNTQAAIALGITREAVKEAQQQGKFAEFLEQKLSAAAAAGALVAKTFEAAKSNLKEAGDTFQAVVTEGLFNQLRDKLNQVLPQIFDTSKANLISDNFKGIADTLTTIFDLAGARIAELIDFGVTKAKELSKFLEDNKALIDETIRSADILADSLVTLSASAFDAFSPEKQTLIRSVKSAIDAVSLSVAQTQDEAEILGAVFLRVIQAIVLGIEGPLDSALSFFGVHIQSLTDDVKRLSDSMDAAAKRIDEGLKNTERIEQRIRDSQNKAEITARLQKLSAEERARVQLFLGEDSTAGSPNVAAPNVSQKTTVTGPKRPPGDDKGTAKARQEAAAELKLLQNIEKEAELTDKRISAVLRAALTDRLISLEDYTQQTIDNNARLLKVELASLDEQEKAAIRTARTKTEAEAKRAEFTIKRQQAQLTSDLKYFDLTDTLRRTQEKAEEDHQNRLIAIHEIGRKAAEALNRASVSSGLITNDEAERRAIELERERFAEREGILNADLANAKENVQERQKIQDQLEQLAVERAIFEESTSGRIIQAQQKEAATTFDILRRRIAGLVELRKAQIEAQAEQDVLRVQRGLLTVAQQQAAEIERKRELNRIESLERQQQIERQAENLRREAQQAQQGATVLLQIEQQKNAALKAEKDRATAQDSVLQNQGRAVGLQAGGFDPQAALQIAATEQALQRTTTAFEQFRIATEATISTLTQQLPTLGAIFEQTANAISDSLAANIAGFVSGAISIRKAAAAFYAAALAPLKDYLLKKAKIQFAEAIESLAIQDYRGFALHSLAGVALSAAAGLIDAGGAAIAGGGGAGSAISAGGGGGAAATAQQRGPITQDSINRDQRAQVVIIRTEVGEGTVVKHWIQDVNNNGQARQILQREGAPA